MAGKLNGAKALAGATIESLRSLASIDEISSFLADVERSAGVPTLLRVRNRSDFENVSYETQVGLSSATFGSSLGTQGMDALTVKPESSLYQARLASASAVLCSCPSTSRSTRRACRR